MHILYAEDSKAIALPVIAMLEKLGHRVTYCQDGETAYQTYQNERPDLVVLDVVMPGIDGIEVTRRIKEISGSRWIPIILMTSLSEIEQVILGLRAGADEYLTKPINFELFAAKLQAMQRVVTIQDSLFGVLNNVYEAILTINEKGIVQSFNAAAEKIFGYKPDEVIGHNIKMLMPNPYAEEHDGYLSRYMKERTPHVIGIGRKVKGKRKNGDLFPMRLSVTEVKQNIGSLFIGLISDISEEEAARQKIEFLALHDTLTGLPNRANFNESINSILSKDDGQKHAVLFIDLDGFKPINDTLGHDAGDEALKAVATRLRHNLAANDFAARLGGDEFVALACNVVNREAVEQIANRLISAISEPLTLTGRPAKLGASIGVAIFPDHGTTPSEILNAADHAMYLAKRTGKGRVAFAGDQN